MFDVKFYCSSKYSSKGYTESAIGSGGEMVSTTFPYTVAQFISLNSINCALLKKDKEYHIILLEVEQPDGFEKRATDISGSEIKINLSISSSEKNEEAVRKLFYSICFNYSEFSCALYKAYDFCATNDIGYSFDEKSINDLIENCIKNDIETSADHLKDYSERFKVTSPEELRRLLNKKLPRNDGVFFAELAIAAKRFETFFDESQFPWYVFDNQYRKK